MKLAKINFKYIARTKKTDELLTFLEHHSCDENTLLFIRDEKHMRSMYLATLLACHTDICFYKDELIIVDESELTPDESKRYLKFLIEKE